jgi:hypothetical protein
MEKQFKTFGESGEREREREREREKLKGIKKNDLR